MASTGTWTTLRRVAALLFIAILMSACNLGQQAPAEPITGEPLNATPQDVQPLQGGATATPLIQVPPTDTPVPQLLPSEQIAAISIDGTDHRALDTITVRIRRGVSVTNMTCSWTLQDTGQFGQLGALTSTTQIDANTFEDVFTLTPDTGGTYIITCRGEAATASGVRVVEGRSVPFLVQQKG